MFLEADCHEFDEEKLNSVASMILQSQSDVEAVSSSSSH
jgi:hypothetical protein